MADDDIPIDGSTMDWDNNYSTEPDYWSDPDPIPRIIANIAHRGPQHPTITSDSGTSDPDQQRDSSQHNRAQPKNRLVSNSRIISQQSSTYSSQQYNGEKSINPSSSESADLGTSTSNINMGNKSVNGINIADAYYHHHHGLGPGEEPPNSETLKEEAIIDKGVFETLKAIDHMY